MLDQEKVTSPGFLDGFGRTQRVLWFLALTVLVIYRLFLPVWSGTFGPDELMLAYKAKLLLSGQIFPLLGIYGTHGLPYGPYPTYFLAFIYKITGFHLGWAYLLFSALLVLAAFFVGLSVRERGYPFWTLLLALTSPLAIYYSMSLWDNTFLIPFSALILFLLSTKQDKAWHGNLIVGLLLGVAIGIHLQVLPFVAAVIVWRFTNSRRVSTLLTLAAGLIATTAPYALGLWRMRDKLHFTIHGPVISVPQPATTPLDLVTSIFRFFGAQPVGRVNCAGTFLVLENWLVLVTSILWVILLAVTMYCVARNWREWFASHSPLSLYILCIGASVPFVFITNATYPHYTQAMWWFAPVILPIVMMQLMPKKAAVCCLSLMVCFNVLTTGIQYAPRLAHGTSAESDAYFWSGSQGVSWWMLRDVVDRISQIEDQRRQSGDTRPLTVQLCPVKYTLFTVPKTMELFDPQRAARIKWVYENEKNWDVSVQADPEAVYMKVIIRAAHAAEAPAK